MTDEEIVINLVELKQKSEGVARELITAKTELNRRLEEMNAFRTQINNERGEFVTRTVFEAKHDSLEKSIAALQKFQYMLIGAFCFSEILVGLLLHLWK